MTSGIEEPDQRRQERRRLKEMAASRLAELHRLTELKVLRVQRVGWARDGQTIWTTTCAVVKGNKNRHPIPEKHLTRFDWLRRLRPDAEAIVEHVWVFASSHPS